MSICCLERLPWQNSHRAQCCGLERNLGAHMPAGEKEKIPGDQKCGTGGGQGGQGEG